MFTMLSIHTIISYNCIEGKFCFILYNLCYRSHHALQGRRTRQESLKSQYKFTCICEACVNNWPTYLSMKPSKNLPIRIIKRMQNALNSEAIEKLQKGHKGTALLLFKPLCELIEELEFYIPCMELSDCQESLKQCLAILEGVLPYGYSNYVQWNAIPPKVD